MKNICILGSTGSIGKSSLDVIAGFPERFRVAYLTTNKNITCLKKQIDRFRPKGVVVLDESSASELKKISDGSIQISAGEESLCELVRRDDVDIVISSLVGFAGLRPTIEAIKRGKTVALANKETLVAAGEIITSLVKEHNARLIPIDSEHSAILQCIAGEDSKNIARLILTASGGPFRDLHKKEFANVTVDAALNHPTWRMGNKITIDSATLMNKGFEVIEAHWLFDLPPEKIDILIHPQSVIHSMVEFIDGSIKAQLGMPDMKIPIQYALTYPGRARSEFQRVDFAQMKQLTFFAPDMEKFECLALAYDALRRGGNAPAALNSANEVAVDLFLHGKIRFSEIPQMIRKALDHVKPRGCSSLDDIIETDRETRAYVKEMSQQMKRT